MDRLHFEVMDEERDGKSRRLTRLAGDTGKPAEVFHEFDRLMPLTDATPWDGHVLALLLYAAALGKPLVVHGPVTRTALRNMDELLQAWSCWKPERYRRIDIIADRVMDAAPVGAEAAIAAFSGGVDATFTALRHATSRHPVRYPVRAALMVHGFDVDVYNAADFKKLTQRVQPLLTALQLEFRTIRTNSRELRLQDWDDSSALELAGCLHMCGEDFRYGLIGSTKSYDTLVLPWGSNPVTDHLMSGDRLRVVHDGAGFSRTEKAAEILNSPLACTTLKVCWAGADQAENCGRCEKCVRTQLNFLAAGARQVPACFPVVLDPADIHAMQINNTAQLVELKSIADSAAKHNIAAPWLPILQQRIGTWQPKDDAELQRLAFGAPAKRAIARSLSRVGADVPAKKVWRVVRRGVRKVLYQWGSLTRVAQLTDEISNHMETALNLQNESGDRAAADSVDSAR